MALKHYEYLIIKTLGFKDDPNSLLHPDFTRKLAECKDQEDFVSLANEVNEKVQQPAGLQPLTNMVKFDGVMKDMAEFYKKRFRSELTARRILQTTKFAKDLAKNNNFRNQLYHHAASIFALLEQQSDLLLIHFDSLLSLGSVTTSLARQQKWDENYIQRVQQLYQMDKYDADAWFTPFNKYLEVRADYKNASGYFKAILNKAVKPDANFNLQRVKVATLTDNMHILLNDIKMITVSTDILSVPGTIFQLERTYSTSTDMVDDEQMSTVDEILSQVSNEANNSSRVISLVNDETQRCWNLSATDLEQDDTDDDSIVMEVCDYFDGQTERICGAPLEPGQTRCAEHAKPEFNQQMELIKQLREIEPGRAYSLMKDLQVEIPKLKNQQSAKYANCMNGDTKENFINYSKEY